MTKPKVVLSTETKRCPKCREVYPALEYGSSYYCKRCDRARKAVQRRDTNNLTGPKPRSKEQEPYLPLTADAFELFFNRFSGMTLTPWHKKFVAEALAHDLVLVNVPPRHAKSTVLGIWLPIWFICRDRDVRIADVSKTDMLALRNARGVAVNLESNQDLLDVFGTFVPGEKDAGSVWRPSEGQLMVSGRSKEVITGDLTLQCRGAGQAILGLGLDLIITDDIVGDDSRSPLVRKNLSDWYHGSLLSRIEVEGRAIILGQRILADDLYGELAEEKDDDDNAVYYHVNFPAIANYDTKEVLWPERWPFEKLMRVKARLGSTIFECMYQQNPREGASRLTRETWLYGDEMAHRGCVDRDRVIGEPPSIEGQSVRVVSLDPSPTKNAGLVVMDVERFAYPSDDLPVFHVLESMLETMNVTEMLSHLDRTIRMYGPDYLVVEANAAQRWLLTFKEFDHIKQQVRVIPHFTSARNKGDAEHGIDGLSPLMESGRIRWPYADPESRRQAEVFFDEARRWPNGNHDDLLMAVWFVTTNTRRFSPATVLSAGNERSTGFNVPPRLEGGFTFGYPDPEQERLRDVAPWDRRR